MTSLTGRRILIAEDESLIALELEETLDDLGYQVVGPVSRVEEVLQRAEARAFDGALLDVNLRGQSIFAVLPRLLELGPPLVITSGYGDVTLFPPQFRTLRRITKPFQTAAVQRICLSVFGPA